MSSDRQVQSEVQQHNNLRENAVMDDSIQSDEDTDAQIDPSEAEGEQQIQLQSSVAMNSNTHESLATDNLLIEFDRMHLAVGAEVVDTVRNHIFSGIAHFTAGSAIVQELVLSGAISPEGNVADLGYKMLLKCLDSGAPDLFRSEDRKMLHKLMEQGCIKALEFEDARLVEKQLKGHGFLNFVEAKYDKFMQQYEFHSGPLTWLYALMSSKATLQRDLVGAQYDDFNRLSCGHHFALDLEVLPDHHWAAKASKTIMLALMVPKAIDQFKNCLAMNIVLPFKLLRNPYFHASMEGDADLLRESFMALQAIVRARCVQIFSLRLYNNIYELRQYQSLVLGMRGGDDTEFHKVTATAHKVIAVATRHVERGLEWAIDSLDTKASLESDEVKYRELLRKIPDELIEAEATALAKIQDWRAALPAVALFYHQNIKAGGGYDVDMMWTRYYEGARKEHKLKVSYFRQKQDFGQPTQANIKDVADNTNLGTSIDRLERIRGLKQSHPDNISTVELPDGIENAEIVAILRGNDELISWAATAEEVPFVEPVKMEMTINTEPNKKRKMGPK